MTASDTAHPDAGATAVSNEPAPVQSTTKTLLGTGVGNALEWYDWNVYASFAVYFSTQVFNKEDPTSAFLATMAVFAVGFVARPFGGLVFGWLGDRIGRKEALTAAVICASVGSLIIAICPTYEQVGWLASAILLIARLLQGLAHGGELPSAQTYLSEHAPREHRGLWASSIYVTGTIGLILGLLLGLILNAVLTPEQMNAWGWRIPFAIGAVLGLFALWIRSSMEESQVFEEHKTAQEERGEKVGIFSALARNWKTALKVIGMTMGLTVAYYIWSVTMPSIAQTSFKYDADQAFTASLVGNVVFIVALPIWGWVSDRIGRKVCAIIGLLGCAVLYFPMFWLIQGGPDTWRLIVAISVQLILLAAFLSHAPAMYAEMFSTEQRTSGFGVPYSIAIATFGGTAGYVLTWMGNPNSFAIYSIVLLVLSSATILFFIPETKGKDLSEAAH